MKPHLEKMFGALALAAVLANSSALAQVSDMVPPRPKALSGKCPGLSSKTAEPACCLLSIDVGADGMPKKAAASCTDPALEQTLIGCQAGQTFEPATQAGKPIPFTVRVRLTINGATAATPEMCEPLLRRPPQSPPG